MAKRLSECKKFTDRQRSRLQKIVSQYEQYYNEKSEGHIPTLTLDNCEADLLRLSKISWWFEIYSDTNEYLFLLFMRHTISLIALGLAYPELAA